ncbi:MAG: alpha/beta fold hydrolase [Propionibacteriaceae bacterium]|nr:alpha/beta fold hydrolase [Propionibacteriaceae bacterium]
MAASLTACLPEINFSKSPSPTATTAASVDPASSPSPEPTPTAIPGPDRPSYPPSDAKPAGFTTAPKGAGLSGYLLQKIKWKKCSGGECATVLAPLDYSHPAEQALTLSLKRIKASKSPKIGTLFINPGGPGASGVEYVTGFARKGLERFDIVGWDPRGVGGSTPVKCFGDKDADKLNALDFSPDTAKERQQLIDADRAFGKSCWEHSGVLLEHISTVETVKDLDLLRQLVGDKKLTYLGYSYGTAIGATYAELFGANIRQMVLDAAVDIADNDEVIQAQGFDTALEHFASWCAKRRCSLGNSAKKVISKLGDWLDKLDQKPVKSGSRKLTQTLAMLGIGIFLYSGENGWPSLLQAVNEAMKGKPAWLLMAGDSLNGRDPDGSYSSLFYSFNAISCLDYSDEGLAQADKDWEADKKKAPFFGKYFGPGYLCPVWPVRPSPELTITGPDAPPILVVGATGDNATPYQQAVDMAKQLVSGVLVTYQGEGHGAFGGNSTCIDKIVIKYLVDGTVPKDGVKCK